jgi:hypothetical protein
MLTAFLQCRYAKRRPLGVGDALVYRNIATSKLFDKPYPNLTPEEVTMIKKYSELPIEQHQK